MNELAISSQAQEFTQTLQICQTTIIEATRSAKPKPQNITAKLVQVNGLSGSQQQQSFTVLH